MEPCEVCGATEGVRACGIDHTPLCLTHRLEAEKHTEWHEYLAAMRGQGLHIGSTWGEMREGFRRWKAGELSAENAS